MQRDGALKFASLLLERLKQLSKYLNTNERNFYDSSLIIPQFLTGW